MPLRLRKFIGAILLITLVVSWALVAMEAAFTAAWGYFAISDRSEAGTG